MKSKKRASGLWLLARNALNSIQISKDCVASCQPQEASSKQFELIIINQQNNASMITDQVCSEDQFYGLRLSEYTWLLTVFPLRSKALMTLGNGGVKQDAFPD